MQDYSILVAPVNHEMARPLSALPVGSRGTLVNLAVDPEALRRMVSLGFTPGTEITIVQNPKYGPLIVLLRNIRIALGRAEAQKILVRRCE